MKKTVWICGLIAGLISTIGFLYTMTSGVDPMTFENGMIYGFASMFLAFSLIFVGIKNYRDKHLGGAISFGKAFLTGLYICLIASTVYVLVWLFYNYNFAPDFMEKYAAHTLEQMRASGADEAAIQQQAEEMRKFGEMYKNPFFKAIFTYTEILPVGLLITVVAALILKRKTPRADQAVA